MGNYPPQTPLRDYFREVYIPDRVNLRPGTIEQFQVSIRMFDRFLNRPSTIDDLCQETIACFMSWYVAKVAASTVNAKRKDLLALWRTAWDRHDTRKAPRKIRRAKEAYHEPRAYSLETMQEIIKQAGKLRGTVGDPKKHQFAIPRAQWWTALILTQYSTAARIGAVRATRTTDCDLGRRTLRLRAETQKQNRDQTFTLIPDAVAAIREIYDRRREYLFWWPYKRRYFHDCYNRLIIKPLGFDPEPGAMNRTHKIRRTTLSHVAAQNKDQAFKLAGHRDPATTERHYLDPAIVNPDGAALYVPSLTSSSRPDPDSPDVISIEDYRAG